MRLYILDMGYLKTDKNNVVASSTMCTRSNPQVMHEFYRLPVMCLLIQQDGRNILYDTGSNMMAMQGH